jgi:predicted dehydrogenase
LGIAFDGRIDDKPRAKVGFIGCGSHAFRNVYPAFQFTPIELVATCDLEREKAQAFARQFGAKESYADHREMLSRADIEAVFIVTGYDANGRVLYPDLAVDCLKAGKHVWIEKPPAASCADIERMRDTARKADRHVMVGFKKMFAMANEHAKRLIQDPSFGEPSLFLLQYPQYIPKPEEFAAYAEGERNLAVMSFLDHICHPMSLLLMLAGRPRTLSFERAKTGAGVLTFTFASGAVASLALTWGRGFQSGFEQTTIVGQRGHHVVVENNTRVTFRKDSPVPTGEGYGTQPSMFHGAPGEATTIWEPEFSLGQLYNKALFLLGYWGEINEFATAVLEKRAPAKATLDDAFAVTRVFELFFELRPGQSATIAYERT